MARLKVELASFKVGGAEIWMPITGTFEGFAAVVDKTPVITKDVTSIETIRVMRDTMQFNKHPSREAFTMKYKPGTPISEAIR
jgi:hypothetical protein